MVLFQFHDLMNALELNRSPPKNRHYWTLQFSWRLAWSASLNYAFYL